jgi:hypothetical protein
LQFGRQVPILSIFALKTLVTGPSKTLVPIYKLHTQLSMHTTTLKMYGGRGSIIPHIKLSTRGRRMVIFIPWQFYWEGVKLPGRSQSQSGYSEEKTSFTLARNKV